MTIVQALFLLLNLAGVLALVIVGGLLLFGALYLSAKMERQATLVPENEIKFVVRGEHLEDIFLNVRGYKVEDGKIIPGKPERGYLEKKFGIRWVSILYPVKRIKTFSLKAAEITSQDPKKPMSQWISSEDRMVSSLRWRFPRPILVEGVELGGDRSKVDILVLGSFQVIDPYMPVFVFKGGFFPPLEDAVRAAVLSVCGQADMTYQKFTTTLKEPGSEFANALLDVNTASTEKSKLANGIREEFGIEMFEVRVVAFDLSPEDRAFKEAARAKEMARLQADAEAEKGKGVRRRLEEEAEGRAALWTKSVGALIEMKVDPNVAADRVGGVIKMESVSGTKLTVLAEGGSVPLTITVPATLPSDDKEEKK